MVVIHRIIYSIISLGVLLLYPNPCFCASDTRRETVDLDLRRGIVRGFSQYIQFITIPTRNDDDADGAQGEDEDDASSGSGECTSQAVMRIDLSGPYKSAKFTLTYDRPRLWTFDLSDSPYGDGYGNDGGYTSNMAEAHIYNRQLRIYGNNLPGYMDASIDGGLLLKVVDGVVKEDMRVVVEASDERVEWSEGPANKQYIESKFLFTLQGQNASYGPTDYDLFVGFNRVVSGTFRTGSGLCRAVVTLNTAGVNECKTGQHSCHVNATCVNTRRSYRCRCKMGFYGNGYICDDENECEQENAGCVHSCVNTLGSYRCTCLPGFELHSDGHNCIDANECFRDRGGCEDQCINTPGSYSCRCDAGYSLNQDEKTCTLGTWCGDNLGCAHHCTSSSRGMTCACRRGYILSSNGRDCIETCQVGNGGCQHQCIDTSRGPECSCHRHYKLSTDLKTCLATCQINNGHCDRRCEDTDLGPKCTCPDGYILHQNKRTCLDVDECRRENGGCSHGCVNTHGSFECICPRGFKVENLNTCTDIDECDRNGTCDHICLNTEGSYTCTCQLGYQTYGITHCADINECSINNGGCEYECHNMPGGAECSCPRNHKLHENGKDCIAFSTCLPLHAVSPSLLACRISDGEQLCTLSCEEGAHLLAPHTSEYITHLLYTCGPNTNYTWFNNQTGSTDTVDARLPTCSSTYNEPHLRKEVKFLFFSEECRTRKRAEVIVQNSVTAALYALPEAVCTPGSCLIDNVILRCGTRRHQFRSLAKRNNRALISVQLDIIVIPDLQSGEEHMSTAARMKRAARQLKRAVNQRQFEIRYDGDIRQVIKRSLKAPRASFSCQEGYVLANNKCALCSIGTYYDAVTKTCVTCTPLTYQDEEGQTTCKPCPTNQLTESHETQLIDITSGMMGSSSIEQCQDTCQPGTYSTDGRLPCSMCPRGTYQPHTGRVTCQSCNVIDPQAEDSSITGASSFDQCVLSEHCQAGFYYSRLLSQCVVCPRDSYQPIAGRDYCVSCPGNTTTDGTGATHGNMCKDRRCGGRIDELQGFIESPNWPGDYPVGVECVWEVEPEKGRRILVVIPEIFLAAQDQCGDILTMRKSSSPYSLLTFETCESTETPIAFTARSRKLWISFQSDHQNNAPGFSIPFVMYNEEYQDLIEDIVRDDRLYRSHQHQQVLKDRVILTALLEVIAQPYNYFKYANVSRTMFPESFIRLLTPKVRRFFT